MQPLYPQYPFYPSLIYPAIPAFPSHLPHHHEIKERSVTDTQQSGQMGINPGKDTGRDNDGSRFKWK